VFILANQMGTSTEMITKYYGHLMTDKTASHLGDRAGRVSTESEKFIRFNSYKIKNLSLNDT
jgi:hypothetical protein